MEQITINFDAHGFDTFESANDYFAFTVAGLKKDERGRPVNQGTIAAAMDLAPSQLTHKMHQRNNTSITLNNAEMYAEQLGDVSWIHYLVYKHIIKKRRNLSELEKMREELDRQIREAKQSAA